MIRREGTSWVNGSEERRVQEKVAEAVPVIRTANEPASVCMEMLENALIDAAASVYALKETLSTRATLQYSANTLKMIKEQQTLLRELRLPGSSSSSLRWQGRPQAMVLLQKAISKAVMAEKRDRVKKILTAAPKGLEPRGPFTKPKQQGAPETVWDADGHARAQALKFITAAEEQMKLMHVQLRTQDCDRHSIPVAWERWKRQQEIVCLSRCATRVSGTSSGFSGAPQCNHG